MTISCVCVCAFVVVAPTARPSPSRGGGQRRHPSGRVLAFAPCIHPSARGTMADALLGSRITLLSNLEVRYEGTLHGINAADQTLTLADGTVTWAGMRAFLMRDC